MALKTISGKVLPFCVGLAFSGGSALLIFELLSDRRCLELKRDITDDYVKSLTYKSKLNKLIRQQEIENEGETPKETMDRIWYKGNVVNPILNRINYVCDNSKEIADYYIESAKKAGLDAYEQIKEIGKADK